MKISADTKDTILFAFGCVGVLTFAGLLPLLGQGFNVQVALFWAGVGGIGVIGGMSSRRREEKG